MRNQYIRTAALMAAMAAMAMSQTSNQRNRMAPPEAGNPDQTNAAGQALENYKDLLDADTSAVPSVMGLPSASEKNQASDNALGTPKRDYFIRLDALKKFKAGDNVEKMLVDSKQVLYPVLRGKRVVGTITMIRKEKGWSLVSVGDADLSRLRQTAINESMKRFQKAEADHFVVRVPALGVEFTAFRNSRGELQLASVADNPAAGLTAGEAEPASRVLPRLVPLALNYRGLEPPKP